MKLVRPCEEYLHSYAEAVMEDMLFRPEGEQLFSDPDTIVRQSQQYELGINLPFGYVKATTFWLIDQNRFIGEINIRHELTQLLMSYGGHIGYEVRWSECGKGYGTSMLKMVLPYCRDILKLKRVLIICDDDNIASAKVIENNGGILENKVINHLSHKTVLTRRYWIEL